jgi:energy-coupling factor transporter ATP-binding protein EcfA2
VTVQITGISIKRLHGALDISVPIKNNRLILVGLNGLGKSTVVNILYYILSRQWPRLIEIDFKSVTVKTKEGSLNLTHAEIEQYIAASRDAIRLPGSALRSLERLTDQGLLEAFLEARPTELTKFEDILGYPSHILSRMQIDIRRTTTLHSARPSEMDRVSQKINQFLGEDQILYLPTYRRIEKDLKAIFPNIEEIRGYRSSISERPLGRRTDAYAELIEFGMEDVQRRINQTMSELNDNNRKEFNALAGSYLRDVIRGQGSTYDREEINNLTDKDVSEMLGRVEENTLDDVDKRLLRESIHRINTLASPSGDDSYVAHFLSKLLQAAQKLRISEEPVTNFVAVCNNYLVGKQIVYDEKTYKLNVVGRQSVVELNFLSSGEKQIVSLFAHLYLSGNRQYLVIIDEPELSLSVPWQQRLLPDLWASKHCGLLVAVTHSPFIFENSMNEYVVDLNDHISYK